MPGLHPDLTGLLAGCRAAPADDTPRLVLADWLEEHADRSGLPSAADARERAELIRVQVELARPTADAARVADLRRAERDLILSNWHRWAGDLPAILRGLRDGTLAQAMRLPIRSGPTPAPPAIDPLYPHNSWRFTRGLLAVDLQPHELADARLREWFQSDLAAWVEEAAISIDGLAELTGLKVTAELTPYLGVRYRLGHGRFPSLSNPHGTTGDVTGDDCRRLLRSRNFGLVRHLSVGPSAVNVGFLRMLAGADLNGIRGLELRGLGIGDTRAAQLAAAPLANLSSLDISDNRIGSAGVRALAASPHLARLAVLIAFRNGIGDAGLTALCRSPLAGSLNVALLQNNGIGDAGIRELAASPLLARLHGPGLNLSMNAIGDGGAAALAGSPHLSRFTELILRENAVGDAGAAALADSPHAANLTYLDLWKNRIGDAGAGALAASPHLNAVRDLSLRDNAISSWGADLLRMRFGDRVKV